MDCILVTGSSGFVGRPACLALNEYGYSVRAFSRSPCEWTAGIQPIVAPSLAQLKRSSSVFDGVNCVLHLAGRAHVMNEIEVDPLAAFRSVNVMETLLFAREAALAGVKRFVFVSSIKVNGEQTSPFSSFSELDEANPTDPYSISKYEAELALKELSDQTGMDLVIVRPPLIYGVGVKGNFRTLLNLVRRGYPLPFGQINNNRRSLLGIANLIDFLCLCCSHPRASGRTFLVSDQDDISTSELLTLIGESMGVPVRLLPIPKSILYGIASISGMNSAYQKICGSLVVNSSTASRVLNWKPRISLQDGLRFISHGNF